MNDFIGQTLGQYHLEALLGTGGMGQVYQGVHQLLKRPAAIKVMLAHYASKPQFRARFLQEARAVAALRHPNVVEIYEFGEQDGTLFLIMELLNDGSLGVLLRQQNGHPLPLPLALDLGSQIAEGLAAAHSMQIIHRDIKPANLLLRRLSGSPSGRDQYVLKITDFGLARLLEGGVESTTGAPMGTLAYMSPEQCIGTKQIDGRSDLYSLGVVLYEMTTGYQPFQIAGVTDALYKHVNVPPPAPRSTRPELPPMVEEIILRCLAKKPEERFVNATALATALRNVLGDSGSGNAISIATQAQATTRTTLEAPGIVAVPPAVSTMPGYADVPRVRVLDQNGQTLQVVEVRSEGITVGRQPGNDIVLVSSAVSRQHLQISWNGKQTTIKDLGSSNGTVLGETRLLPEVAQVWEERQMIHLGSFWLRLESASAPLTHIAPEPPRQPPRTFYNASTTPSSLPGMGVSSPSLVNERIGLSIAPKAISIIPGQSTNIQVTLTNMGSTVDWFTPKVEGVPSEWVQGAGEEVQLNPGMQETVPIAINVARQPANRARDYSVTIRATSREQPQQFSTTKAIWTVQAYKEDAMRLEPRRATGRGQAAYSIALRNSGNVAGRYTLRGEDDEQQLDYQFRYNPVDLDAGQEARIPLVVHTRRHLLGREQRVPFQVHAGPIDNLPGQTLPGEFVNKPLLPSWVVPMFLALLLIGGGIASFAAGLPPFARGGTATPTPGINFSATLTALAQSNSNAAATQIANVSATATVSANGTATATTQGASATATAQTNATATAQTNATATAGTTPTATPTPTLAQQAAQYTGTWLNNNPNTNDIPQLIITSSGDTLTIHGYGACSPSYCDWGTVNVQFTGSPVVATFVFDGSRPGACCTGASSLQLTITFTSADQTQMQVINTQVGSSSSTTDMMHKS